MATSQKFCLKWNNFQNSVTSVFDNLRQDEELVDITLCCEGKKIKAHRMMLSACSPYFRDLFKDNPCQHPLFFLKDTSYVDIAAVIEFVYKGEVNVLQSQLASFLKTAETLQVKGLSGDEDEEQAPRSQAPPSPRERPPDRPRLSGGPQPPPPSRPRPRESTDTPASPLLKRRRLSGSSVARPGSPSLVQHVQPAVSAAPPPPVSRDPAGDVTVAPPAAAALPPPPPPVSGAELPPQAQHEPPPPPPPPAVQPDYGIKVEKIDIADDDDDDASLEATLGQVSTFEASQYDGSDHSASSNDMGGLVSGRSDQVGGDMLPPPPVSAEDAASQDLGHEAAMSKRWKRRARTGSGSHLDSFACDVPGCSMSFRRANRLSEHRAWHRGETRCNVCGRDFNSKYYLMKHKVYTHGVMLQSRSRRAAISTALHHTAADAAGAGERSDASSASGLDSRAGLTTHSATGAGLSTGSGTGARIDSGAAHKAYSGVRVAKMILAPKK